MENRRPFDLDEVTIINESRSESRPGDVSIFRTPQDACRSLEAWWVKDAEGTALTGTGDQLVLAPTEPVSVRSRKPHPDGERLVFLWLSALGSNLQRVRKDAGPLPTAITELIEYIGFER